MSTISADVTKPTISARQLGGYPLGTTQLIPLNSPTRKVKMPNGKVVPVGKAPLHSNWQKRPYDSAAVIANALKSGGNVGVRMTSTQVVVDVDPRNGGDDGWLALCHDIGIDADEYPTVVTGSGGLHVYMSLPKGTLVRDTLEAEEYRGVEFKSKGRQVVAAGSIHPTTGKPYFWRKGTPPLSDGWPAAPTGLVNLARRPPRSAVTGGGQYTPEQLAAMLSTMKPEEFAEQSKWFKLMQACHHATNGDARYEFLAWSICDPDFEDDADVIGRRWDSLHADKNDGLTFKTLRMFVGKHGDPSTIPSEGVGDDFDDDISVSPADPDAWLEAGEEAAEAADRADMNAAEIDWDAPVVIKPMHYDMVKLDAMLDHAEVGMSLGGAPVYQMAGRLVHPVRLESASNDDDTIRRATGALTTQDVSALRLTQFLTEHVPLYKIITPPNGAKPVKKPLAPPLRLAEHLIARRDRWTFPHLTGTIETPTLRRNGSLLTDEGYDLDSGLLLDKGGLTFPAVPETPTRAEALTALAFLKKPLAGFPFVPDGGGKGKSASRSVMLSAILTAPVRRSLRSAPMHGFSAPTPGTGKTLAVQVASVIATGHEVTAMSQGTDGGEDEKRLLSVLLQGDQMVLIDNVTRPIGGNTLCTILTEQFWQGRVLGVSRNATVATNVLMTASGNNLVFEGDMTRRALLCRMDAGIENPEGRSFDLNLKEWVPKHRVELVVAVLTVLRAFVAAGRPGVNDILPFGSFEDWSDLVRGALVWLGEPDPCLTRQFIAADDPVKAELGEFLRAARVAMSDRWFTAGDLLAVDEVQTDPSSVSLMEIIDSVAPREDRAKLGRYLKSHENQIIGGLRLRGRRDDHRKVNTYRVFEQ